MIHATLLLSLVLDLPHREAALKAAVAQSETASPSRLDQALVTLAEFLQERGRYAEAEPLYIRSASLNETSHGSKSLEAASSWLRLGILYHLELRLALAESSARKAMDVFEALEGPDSLHYAYASANLAVALADQGQPARAEPLLRRALFLVQKHLPPENPAIASLEANLGIVYLREGELHKAEPLLQDVLAKAGSDADRSSALAALAELSIARGRWPEAGVQIRDAYRLALKSEDDNHPALLGILRLKAAVEQHEGDLRQAAVDLGHSMVLTEAIAGPDSPTLKAMLTEFADILHRLGRHSEARAARRRAKAIKQVARN
jgi:tetratricopeptide (TPR) repeat protein